MRCESTKLSAIGIMTVEVVGLASTEIEAVS
jgi:hypothetical protein